MREDVDVLFCITTQAYEAKSETTKVTSCGALGYWHSFYGYVKPSGEHQVCPEEISAPGRQCSPCYCLLDVSCSFVYPTPTKVYVIEVTEITLVKCEYQIEKKCYVAKFADVINPVEQKEIVIGRAQLREDEGFKVSGRSRV